MKIVLGDDTIEMPPDDISAIVDARRAAFKAADTAIGPRAPTPPSIIDNALSFFNNIWDKPTPKAGPMFPTAPLPPNPYFPQQPYGMQQPSLLSSPIVILGGLGLLAFLLLRKN